MKSCDVGSLPFAWNETRFLQSVSKFRSSHSNDAGKYFQSKVIAGFRDKAKTGINIPYYPQFRDMNYMFLELIDGIEKVKKGYVESERMSLKAEGEPIPEVKVIKENSNQISEVLGHPFELGVCITGPYTLSFHFAVRDEDLFLRLGRIISQLIEKSIFNGKHGRVSMVSVDEPSFGLMDDALIDPSCEARENLRKAWELIFNKASSKSVQTCIHLHSAADKLFWDVESLNVIESEMNNSLYRCKETKKLLEAYDKFLKANVCASNLDQLLAKKTMASLEQKADAGQKIKENWKQISNGKLNPTNFLEDVTTIRKRVIDIVKRFSSERVPYAGPECGLKGFPTYNSALECLRRVAAATSRIPAEILAFQK